MKRLAALDVARYFIQMDHAPGGTGEITNLKVQKLCYYAQGFALARHNRPLFYESIERWEHGPVVPPVWREYRNFRASPIHSSENSFDPHLYDSENRELLDEVFRLFGTLPAWELRNKTHLEPPWTDTPDRAAITHQKLRDYFGPLISDLDELGHDQSELLQGQALASKMMKDHMLRKLTERGYADLAAGRYSPLEEVRQTLGDV